MTGGQMLAKVPYMHCRRKHKIRIWWKVMLLLYVPPTPRIHGLVFPPLLPVPVCIVCCLTVRRLLPSFPDRNLKHQDRDSQNAAMRYIFCQLVAFLAFIYGATAQTATANALASFQTVLVGYEAHSFEPNNLTARPGDVIVFQFIAEGHTVVQSNFEEPCVPRDAYHRGRSTFFSGWYNSSDVHSDNPPTWNLTVNDTTPIFFYCSRLGSCLDNKMIGSINQNATYTLQAQLDSINSSDIMLQPGQQVPEESIPTSTSAPSTSHHGVTLSGGAIAGIVIAGVAVLALACALFWFVGRHRTLKHTLNSQSSHSAHSGAVESWVDSTHPPSTVGGPPSARPPSYGPDAGGYMVPMDGAKHWDYSNQRQSYMPMTPPIQELGISDPVEMEETGRGRTRSRNRENEPQIADPKVVGVEPDIYEKE
ncbi:hypothetical protein E4T42_02553 [Aureobasidium subglaciale]|nr:hypothetical protein E4T42_02553 [Aureobasidium subglaciale]